MPRLNSANNADTTLSAGITATSTSLTVADASLFPNAPFRITIDAEIIEVGAIDRATNTFSSLIRGQEGTTAASHSAGASVQNRFTAGTYSELATDADLDDLSTQYNAFVARRDNPHAVTAAQAGALPITGGTLTGVLNLSTDGLTTPQLSGVNMDSYGNLRAKESASAGATWNIVDYNGVTKVTVPIGSTGGNIEFFNNIRIASGLTLQNRVISTNQNSLNVNVSDGSYWLFEGAAGANAQIFRGHMVRLVFETVNAKARIERYDGSAATLQVGSTTYTSDASLKKNINEYQKSALEEIKNTPIRQYHMLEDDDRELMRTGILLQEAPIDVVDPSGYGVDAYSMLSMAWKAIQELDDKITSLERSIS